MDKKLEESVTQKIKTTERNSPFAVFDFDNTCIVNDIAEATLNHMAANALFSDDAPLPGLTGLNAEERARKILNYYYALIDAHDIKTAYAFNTQVLGGLNVTEIEPLVARVLESEGQNIGYKELFGLKISRGLVARPQVIEIMKQLENEGVAVWVVTASPEALVAAAMKHLGVPGKLIGAKNKIVDGVITAELEYPLSIAEGKVECIKKFIHPEARPVLGVGDSENDLPMLEYSELKAVVDRGNSLTEKAKNEGWFLI